MNLFYKVLDSFENKIFYPKNDIDAYVMYPKYSDVYNKLNISKFQNVLSNPFPILPIKYPIISKPIINLNGMGLGAKIIKSEKEFYKDIESTNFWSTYLEGDHYSWDIILRNGKILYYTCFFGKKWKFGTFKFWRQEDKEIPNNVIKILEKFLVKFTGNINMETIGDIVIEVHLRMGDIDLTDSDVILLSLLNLSDKKNNIIKRQLKIVNNKKIKKINLIPVWEKKFINFESSVENKYLKIKEIIVPYLQEDDLIVDYYIDSPQHPDPENYKRWFLLLTYDLEYGIKLGKKIEKQIKNLSLDSIQTFH